MGCTASATLVSCTILPSATSQVMYKKYTWHISIMEKSFHGSNKSYQVNCVITALGRHPTIPWICATVCTALCSSVHVSFPAQIKGPAGNLSNRIVTELDHISWTPQQTAPANPLDATLAPEVSICFHYLRFFILIIDTLICFTRTCMLPALACVTMPVADYTFIWYVCLCCLLHIHAVLKSLNNIFQKHAEHFAPVLLASLLCFRF